MNRRLARWQERRADDAGASLLITLAFVAFVGLVAGALLSFSGTSVLNADKTKYRGDVVYDVDGALQAGINQIRNSKFVNIDPAACGRFLNSSDGSSTTTALNMTGSNSGRDVLVKCEGGPTTGLDNENVPIYSANRPGQALLTLDPSGTNIQNSNNGTLNIKGKVSANGGINASPGTIAVQNAPVVAGGACSGVTSTVSVTCNSGTTFSDPNYTVATGTMARQAAPSCSGSQKLVTFSPGYYDDAMALSDLMKGGGCKAYTYWFQPGVYYFDFRNSISAASGLTSSIPAGADEWVVDDADVNIVGGTPSGWTTTTAAAGTKPALPGSCISPLTTKSNDGVMFVFGGDSRINLKKGQMELCGQYYADKLPIAVYAAKTGAAPGSETATTPGVDSYSGSDKKFTNTTNITATDGTASTVTINKNDTASVTVSGLVPTGGIDQYSILTKAELQVVHKEVATAGSSAPTSITLTPTAKSSSGNTTLTAVNATPALDTAAGAFRTETLNITTALAPHVYTKGLTDLSVQYTVKMPNTNGVVVNENLDSIKLVLTWEKPSIRPVSSTVNVGGTNCLYHRASCDLITTAGNNLVDMYIQGTTYAPQASLNINLNNTEKQVFRSGIVAWSVRVDINPNGYPGAVIEIPDLTLDYTDVYFTAYVCPADTACSASPSTASGWKKAATARVAYTDNDISDPTVGARKVKVYSWSTYR
jgi:hypothetical protein